MGKGGYGRGARPTIRVIVGVVIITSVPKGWVRMKGRGEDRRYIRRGDCHRLDTVRHVGREARGGDGREGKTK